MSERERFEKWRDGIRFPYPDAESGYAWEGWQACASKKDAEIERLREALKDIIQFGRNTMDPMGRAGTCAGIAEEALAASPATEKAND